MKKIILLFAMMLAVAGVQAQSVHKMYATPTRVSGNGNISWNESTNTFTVTDAGSNTYQIFEFPAGTLSKYSKINITISNTNDRVLFMYNDGSEKNVSWSDFGSTGLKNKALSEISGLSTVMSQITSIRIGGPKSGGTVSGNIILNPSETWLESEAYEGMDIKTTITSSSDNSTPFAWAKSGGGSVSVTNNMSVGTSGIIFGYNAGTYSDSEGYFDITGYDRARTKISSFNSSNSKDIRLIYGSSNTVIASCIENTTLYDKSCPSLGKIHSIKSGAGASNAQIVENIVFTKEFSATSTTPFNIAASASSTVNYDRTFTTDKKATVCLPFDLTAAQVTATGGKFYQFIGATASTLQFQEVSSTTAYTPYIFVAGSETTPFASLTNIPVKASASAGATITVEHNGFTFTGTLAKTNVASDSYGIHNDAFVKAGTGVTIKAFRAYFTGSFSEAHEMSIDLGGDVTGIKTMNHEPSTVNQMYNLQGQRVSEGHKGLVIVNGKKVVMK